MAKRISVIVSQGQSQNPAKRKLEESIVTALMTEAGMDVTVVPHLYDLKPDGTGMLALKSISGNMIVLSWLFERAAHWILDRNGIDGHVGVVELKNETTEEDEELAAEMEEDEKERVIHSRQIPDRKIYCLDLRVSDRPSDFIDEIRRIQNERSLDVVSLGSNGGSSLPAERFENPTNQTALNRDGTGLEQAELQPATAILNRIEESAARRWYPVIDYSRCTNCMECIDFCLFGVYGVDRADSILVEQPDNCRKGCPACSRVCPENAIMFPQHKTPAIAGSEEVGGSLKIDLSKLFGAPEEGKSAEEIAALERDEQLIAAGRDAVGFSLPRRQASQQQEPKDELDSLVDELDELDL
ncbi:MAG: ferredoxin family protein [Planctomycetota bacterium]|nr:ferredoxin family protein [Planctomycetota bacterium]